MSRNLRNQNFDDPSGNDIAPSQDLDWLAFQYVSDELPELERERFENRLETDLDAQTALVDIMQQSQLIYSALSSEQSSEWKKAEPSDRSAVTIRRSLLGRQSALLAAAAAVLLMVAGWAMYNGFHNAPNGSLGIATGNAQTAADLAVAWADTIADRDLILIESEFDELAEEVEFVDFVSNGPAEDSEDWMLIALVDLEESAGVLD